MKKRHARSPDVALARLPSRDNKRGVHPAFSLSALKSKPRLLPPRERKSPDVAPTVLRATAVGLQHDDRRDERFRGPSELTQLAQAQTDPAQPAAPAPPAPDPAAPAADAQAPEEPIGNVATVTGSASVIRNDKTTPLKVKDDIYLNDVVQTGANSALGITFIDATTFNLKAEHEDHHRQLRL